MFAKKPLLFGKENSSQDEAQNPSMADSDEVRPFYDASSVPGHAEITLANDIDQSRLPDHVKRGYYKRFGTDPKPLPAELRWVRESGPDGSRSYNAEVTKMQYRRDGYRPATTDDLRRAGYGLPVAGEVLADGSIRREDTRLYIIDGDRARELESEARERANASSEREAAHPGDVWLAVEDRERGDPRARMSTTQNGGR